VQYDGHVSSKFLRVSLSCQPRVCNSCSTQTTHMARDTQAGSSHKPANAAAGYCVPLSDAFGAGTCAPSSARSLNSSKTATSAAPDFTGRGNEGDASAEGLDVEVVGSSCHSAASSH
jgi:hypothetical protein